MRISIVITLALLLTLPSIYGISFCTEGVCCYNGNILHSGTVCREALDVCDVTEYCTGLSSACPPDVTVKDEVICTVGLSKGTCLNGTCMTEEAIAKFEVCESHCSENGKCSIKGICVCNAGWESPPKCDKKTSKGNSQEIQEKIGENPKLDEKPVDKQNEQVLVANRNRRETKRDGHHNKKHHTKPETKHKHKNHHKIIAMPLSIQDPPTQDTLTELKNHPLFLPVIITIVGLVILVAFTISARILYQSEQKARLIRERIKVEKATSEARRVPKNVSKINDPAVNIDVGR